MVRKPKSSVLGSNIGNKRIWRTGQLFRLSMFGIPTNLPTLDAELRMRCGKCKSVLPCNGLRSFCCGHWWEACGERDEDLRGFAKMEICKTNQCGMYDHTKEACLEVIRIGLAKDPPEIREGKVDWLKQNPDAKCVHPTNPLF